MADFILQATLSNLLVSAILAAIAWFIQKRYRAASLANLLWIMVLIKMITPPLFAIPLLEVGAIAAHNPVAVPAAAELEDHLVANTTTDSRPVPESAAGTRGPVWLPGLAYAWVLISALLLAISLLRVIRFHYCLQRQLLPATEALSKLVRQVANQIGIRRLPRVVISQANLSPFVWWTGGRPLVVIPQLAIEGLAGDELRLIVAHELAHVKRRDYYVRWLEWLSGIALWWNPVLWVARRQLRTTEEIACDAMVVETIGAPRQQYARSLLNMAELLTTSTLRPPAVASAINSGGILEKRLTMIVSQTNLKLSNWMCLAVFLLAIGVLPIGLVYAQDYEAVQKRLVEAVKSGEISRAQAGAMLETLKGTDKAKRGGDRDMEALRRRYQEGARRIEAAVEAGEVSKEDAEKRLIEMRKAMFPTPDQDKAKRGNDPDMEALKRRYQEGARRIEAAVEAGKVSKEDAEKRLIEMRKAMFPETGTKSKLRDNKSKTKNGKEMASLEARKKIFQQSEKIILDAVKSGKVSEKDAKKRLGQMRADMFPEFEDKSKGGNNKDKAGKEKVDRQMEGKKNRYMKAAAGIEAEVKAGKISKEDAEKRLGEMRKAMFPETNAKADDQADPKADEKADGQRRRRLFRRNGG